MALTNDMKKRVADASYKLLKKAAKVSLTSGKIAEMKSKRASLNRRATKLMKLADGTMTVDVSQQVKKYENQLLFGTKKKVVVKNKASGKEIIRTRTIVPRELMA
jgi:basic membrane lipoprotein Med (substrate-binding protein (PBP1-ABC) superfamily)